MGDDIKPEVIKRTQDALGKYIKKPPLTEKLLKKPPFRFLHDIITAVIRETGFLRGLYTTEELNHENIKDRDGKVAFLQKTIDAVKTITGTNLTVRPTKIVAGHEPTKTNELLQAIGKALDKKQSSEEYVESLQKKGKKPSKTSLKDSSKAPPVKPTSQARARSQDRAKGKEAEKKKPITKANGDTTLRSTKSKSETPKEKSKKSSLPAEVSKQEESQPQPDPIVPVTESAPTVGEEQVAEAETKRPQSARIGHRKPSANLTSHTAVEAHDAGGDTGRVVESMLNAKEAIQVLGSPQPYPNIEVESALPPVPAESVRIVSPEPTPKSEILVPKSARPRPQTALRPPSARPPSARPAAPRIRDRGEVRVPEEISSSPIAGKVNVITENESITEQDEDENFIVVESQSTVQLEEPPALKETEVKPVPEGQHGHLVTQILETQKELEDNSHRTQDGQSKKVEIEWEAGSHREREVVSREVERLRSSIQTLTRAANPLGKLMDFLQEDVDSMQRELETWRRTNATLVSELRAEQNQTETLTEPLKQNLQQLETSIEEELNQLSALKATVLRNDHRIQRLLMGQDVK